MEHLPMAYSSMNADQYSSFRNGFYQQKPIRIGYWMSPKKLKKMDMNKFSVVCRASGFELVQIDFTRPLDQQGPLDVFLHKLTDIIVKAEQNDGEHAEAVGLFRCLEGYIKLHPETIIIDPIENVKKLLLRQRQYYLTKTSDACLHDKVFTPAFVELFSPDPEQMLRDLRQSGVKFPIVCKALEAHGSSDAHRMMIIFNADGLKIIGVPCVAQSFVNHDAILYKVFVIGDKFHVVRRPSFENFHTADLPPIVFDSQNIAAARWICDDPLRLESLPLIAGHKKSQSAGMELDPEILSFIVKGIRKQFGLSLIGIDLIVELATQKFAIIDVNAFPSYDGVPDFFQSLLSHIQSTLLMRDAKLCLMNGGHSPFPKPSRVKSKPELIKVIGI